MDVSVSAVRAIVSALLTNTRTTTLDLAYTGVNVHELRPLFANWGFVRRNRTLRAVRLDCTAVSTEDRNDLDALLARKWSPPLLHALVRDAILQPDEVGFVASSLTSFSRWLAEVSCLHRPQVLLMSSWC